MQMCGLESWVSTCYILRLILYIFPLLLFGGYKTLVVKLSKHKYLRQQLEVGDN